MKLKYIFASIVAALAVAVSCTKEADSFLNEVKVSTSYLAFPANGGTVNMTVTATDSWSISELPEWVSASTLSGSQGEANVTFTAAAAEATREGTFKIVCAGKNQLINVLQVTEAKEPEIITVAQALAAIKAVDKGDGGSYNLSGTFYVKGIVCRISEISTQYGNATYWLSDDGKYSAENALQVYRGLWLEGAAFTSGDEFAIGDELTIAGQLMSYKGTPETAEKTAYVVSISKSLIGIEGVQLLDVEEGEGVTEFPLEGGRIKVGIMTKGDGFHVEIPADAKGWLHIDDFGSNYVTLAADPNMGGDRSVSVSFTTEDGGTTYSCEQSFTQKGAIMDITAAEFNKLADGNAQYRLKGVITDIVMDKNDATKYNKYGNFHIQDGTGSVYVYGLLPEAGGASGQDVLTSMNAKVGDVITVVGPKGSYKGSPQMVNAYSEEFVPVQAATAAEFNALEDGSALYMISGKITKIVMDKNDATKYNKYGNFYVADETGEVYVYGLVPTTGKSGTDMLTTLGIKEGDMITVVGPKGSYKGSAQMVNGYYVSHQEGTAEPDPEEPEQPGELGPFGTNVTCTTVASAYTDGVINVTLGETTVENVFTLKMGTGSKYGTATITLPAGTKSVSYYAIAWKNNPATLKFSVGDTVIGTQAVAANDGATGSSPYTATITSSDKYVINLAEALAADTEVKVETFEDETNKGYRVILFGIQAAK